MKTVKTLSSAVQTQNDPNDATNAVALSVTEEERNTYTSMIVPVWVSTKQNPSCHIHRVIQHLLIKECVMLYR